MHADRSRREEAAGAERGQAVAAAMTIDARIVGVQFGRNGATSLTTTPPGVCRPILVSPPVMPSPPRHPEFLEAPGSH